MDYYHRYDANGSCETICTRCFSALGRTKNSAEAKLIEAAHICARKSGPEIPQPPDEGGRSPKTIAYPPATSRPRYFFGKTGFLDKAQILLLILSMFVCLYLLPSVIELEMMKRISAWFSCILFGDIVGCSFLSLVLEMRMTGVLLYGVVTGAECWLYAVRLVPIHLLPWVADSVPTLLAASLIAFSYLFRTEKSASAE